ncbi:hypothetical protein OG320_08400 [Microbispora sp. NBC_01189]|uniref:hypothetical protein n=1 Tax=Microbispora sp. NBC_01189 TaxID=2903583 RepID=UPI002E1607D7|nr:hypothetical protein OG320_08400 [Microbispora sp. NBC_01189]
MESGERLRALPVLMLQTALNGVGQALLIGDKVRSRIKRLVVGEEEGPEKAEAPDAATRDEQAAEPATRREPVIFAPRPSKAERDGEKDGEKTAASAPAPTAAPTTAPTVTPTPAPAETEADAVPASEAKVQESLGAPKPETAPEAVAPKPAPETAPETAPVAPAKKPRARRKPVTETTAAKTPESAVEETGSAAGGEGAAVSEGGGGGEQAEPLPGYANLTFASLRSRLRGKSAEQVHALLDYEKAHANRPEVVRMFQNRLSKLQSES